MQMNVKYCLLLHRVCQYFDNEIDTFVLFLLPWTRFLVFIAQAARTYNFVRLMGTKVEIIYVSKMLALDRSPKLL